MARAATTGVGLNSLAVDDEYVSQVAEGGRTVKGHEPNFVRTEGPYSGSRPGGNQEDDEEEDGERKERGGNEDSQWSSASVAGSLAGSGRPAVPSAPSEDRRLRFGKEEVEEFEVDERSSLRPLARRPGRKEAARREEEDQIYTNNVNTKNLDNIIIETNVPKETLTDEGRRLQARSTSPSRRNSGDKCSVSVGHQTPHSRLSRTPARGAALSKQGSSAKLSESMGHLTPHCRRKDMEKDVVEKTMAEEEATPGGLCADQVHPELRAAQLRRGPPALRPVRCQGSSLSPAPLLQSISLDAVEGEMVEVASSTASGRQVEDEGNWWRPSGPAYLDENTGEPIAKHLADEKAEEECSSMEEWGVWDVVPWEQARARTGKPPIRTRWVRVNKGDAETPDIRVRLVGMEVAYQKDVEFFSATPPLEALKALISWTATRPPREELGQGDRKIMVVDAKKAHIHAWAQRELYIELPPERAQPGKCGKLRRSLYGFRDAPALWEAYLADELEKIGFVRGKSSAATFHHPKWNVRAVVHGDDFSFAGYSSGLLRVRKAIDQAFLLKDVGTLGWDEGDVQELRILNRIVTLIKNEKESGISYEADPRHAELLVAALGPEPRGGISTPGEKIRRGKGHRFEEETGEDESEIGEVKKQQHEQEEGEADEEALPPHLAHLYRAGAARANFLAMDRPDLSWSAKELCRRMSAPRREDMLRLRRLARYLVEAPRLVSWFAAQSAGLPVRAFADTDFAGCPDTRRSTSGGCLLRGQHHLKHWSVTQKCITLSTGEAELSGCVKGAAEGLGLQALLADLGEEVPLELWTDSSAAIGIAKRSGIGRIRHLAVALLWLQEKVKNGELDLYKVLGEDNPADLMTKSMSRPSIDKHLKTMSFRRETGRAKSAPKVSSTMEPYLATTAPLSRNRSEAARPTSTTSASRLSAVVPSTSPSSSPIRSSASTSGERSKPTFLTRSWAACSCCPSTS